MASERAHRSQSLVLRLAIKDQAMEIEGTTFGTITIDGKTYEHDVIIRLSGEVVKRKKKLSKKYYGTSHVLSKDEAKFVFESGCEKLILGSGQMGNVHLSPEAEAFFAGMHRMQRPTGGTEMVGVREQTRSASFLVLVKLQSRDRDDRSSAY